MNAFQIIDQNHGPLDKYQFLDFFNFVILESKNAFFLSRTSSNTFSCLILPKIKGWKNFKFLTKAVDLPLWKNPDFFFTFVTSCFLQSKKAFFLSRISSNTFSCLILPKIERWKNFKLLTKTIDFPLQKNLSFSIFFLFLFLSPGNTSFLSRIASNTFSWPIFLF